MAPKRRNRGDGEVKSQDDSANPDDGASAEFAKPLYLVAEQEGEQSAYSVFKIDAAAGGRKAKRRRVHTIAAGLPGTAPGMSFVAVHSKHGSWIVGVGGGLSAGTVIFDPTTSKTYRGPLFLNPMCDPIVISHGNGEVYALSRRPRVVPMDDFEPWFHSLSFNGGLPYCTDSECRAYWLPLEPPPFFPSTLNPFQFRNPPEISVTSYAALDSHILLSTQQESFMGTYAFHVVNKTWEKVHAKNLPFVGQATSLGGSLFVACSISSNASASLFHMSINVSSSTPMSAPSLSIQEFPLTASEGKIPKPLFCPLGNASFCAIMVGSSRQRRNKHNSLESDQLLLTTFQIEEIDAISTACQSTCTDTKSLQVSAKRREQRHIYKSSGRSRVLDSDMPVVAALSMGERVHRKMKTWDRHGRRARAISDDKASIKDLELEDSENHDQNKAQDQEIVNDDCDEGLANADELTDKIEDLNPAMMGHDDSNEGMYNGRGLGGGA